MDLSVPPLLGGANPPLSETSPRTIAVGLGHREAFEQQYPYHWMVKNLEECKRLHLGVQPTFFVGWVRVGTYARLHDRLITPSMFLWVGRNDAAARSLGLRSLSGDNQAIQSTENYASASYAVDQFWF